MPYANPPETRSWPVMARLDTGAALEREGALLVEASLQPSLRYLWFWEGSQALVVPRKLAVNPGFERACEMMRAGGWPVHVRATGGDVTPQGPGIFNMTHVYTRPAGAKMSLAGEYDLICGPIERALGPGATRGWQPGASLRCSFSLHASAGVTASSPGYQSNRRPLKAAL